MLGARKFAKTRGFTGELTAVLHRVPPDLLRWRVSHGILRKTTDNEVTPPIVGPIIENPLHGERIRFLKTVPETNGELVQYESWLAPGGGVGLPHVHPVQESHFTVVSGTASFSIHGARFQLGPGQELTVPPQTEHCLWNAGGVEAHLVVSFRPGLLKQEFSETTFGLARDGRYHLRGFGSRLQWAVIAAAYRRESRTLGQPRLMRLGLLALAPMGWLLGYRAHYARYCTRPDGRPDGPPNPPDTDWLAS
jgi:mannose-6-phosphate isomerase-like protein (cupin superfamily)